MSARAVVATLAVGLLLLAVGYWGAWLPHPAAGLNILGVDLAEYVKFIPEVKSGRVAVTREVFYLPLVSLALGLILLGTIRRPTLPRWLRFLLIALAVPVALAMLPPAWTPGLLPTPEFRKQTVCIVLLLTTAALSPLLYRFLPDWGRGVFYLALAFLPLPALLSFQSLRPALETLYRQPVSVGLAVYLVATGAIMLAVAGILLLVDGWKTKRSRYNS